MPANFPDQVNWPDVASASIALAALAQPWIIKWWENRNGTIQVYETWGQLEVGYANWGPVIGLAGTLFATHRDQAVRNISLTLTRLKDNAKHTFEWGFFRTERYPLNSASEVSLELPSILLVSPTKPHAYNIIFWDSNVRDEIGASLARVSASWPAFVSENYHRYEDLDKDALFEALYADFSASTSYMDAYRKIDRLCYWDEGEYQLDMLVRTINPDKVIQKSWKFSISEDEMKSLHVNTVIMLRRACNLEAQNRIIYVKYEVL